MKVLLISDVHAKIEALEAVEKAEKTFDEVWFAGDIIEFGYNPHECLKWLRDRNAKAVLGNHDGYVVDMIKKGVTLPENPFDAENITMFTLANLDDEDKKYLLSLPTQLKWEAFGNTYFMEHVYQKKESADFYNDLAQFNVVNMFDEYWEKTVGESKGEKWYVVGHSHHCMVFQPGNNRKIINPGSVSYRSGPDTPIQGCDYMIIDDGVPFFKSTFCDTSHLFGLADKFKNMNDVQKSIMKSLYPKCD